MKKGVKTKKITIDKLAIMMNNSFERIEEKMATKEDLKNLEIRMNGKFEGVNNRIDDIAITRTKSEDFNKLKVRVDFIEKNLK